MQNLLKIVEQALILSKRSEDKELTQDQKFQLLKDAMALSPLRKGAIQEWTNATPESKDQFALKLVDFFNKNLGG